MNHFLHLLVLLPALFTTIVALPTPIGDTSNSWTDPSFDTADTLLAATFGGVTDNPLTSPASPVTLPALPATNPTQPPSPTINDQDWSKPMFLCCNSVSWWRDEADEVQCIPRSRSWNNNNCMAGQGTAKYCPRGISSSVILDCYKYRAGPGV